MNVAITLWEHTNEEKTEALNVLKIGNVKKDHKRKLTGKNSLQSYLRTFSKRVIAQIFLSETLRFTTYQLIMQRGVENSIPTSWKKIEALHIWSNITGKKRVYINYVPFGTLTDILIILSNLRKINNIIRK